MSNIIITSKEHLTLTILMEEEIQLKIKALKIQGFYNFKFSYSYASYKRAAFLWNKITNIKM